MKQLALLGHQRPITKVMYNYTGDLLFSSSSDGSLLVWDANNGAPLGKFTIPGTIPKVIWGFDVTYDSKLIAAASAEGIYIVDLEDALAEKQHIYIDSVCRAICWNKKPGNQRRFAAVRDAFTARVKNAILLFEWNDEEGQYVETAEINDFTSTCSNVTWGPFDETLISCHENGSIIVWGVATLQKVSEKALHDKKVTAMDFNRDRSLCLTTSLDYTACLWATHDWSLIQKYVTDRRLNGCSISPLYDKTDGTEKHHILVAGGQPKEMITTRGEDAKAEAVLMNMVTAEILGYIAGHFSPVNSLAFNPDGKSFTTGAEEGKVHIYKFDA